MEIDWKILIAQIINFAILFFILKKFLYKPFFDLLENRRKKIQEGIDNSLKADERIAQLKEWKANMERKNSEDRTGILAKAQSEAKKRESQTIKDAEEKKAALLVKAQKEAEDLKKKEAELMKRKTVESAFYLAEELLKESIDKEKGKKISEEFLSKLKI